MKLFKPKWQTWWTIVGPKLPQSELQVAPGIWLAQMSEEDFARHREEVVPVPSIKAQSDCYIVRYPPRDVVQSRYRLQIDVADVDEIDAAQHAKLIADRLIMSLTLAVPGGRYNAEMRKIRCIDEQSERSDWSQSVTVTPLADPLPLKQTDIERAVALSDWLENDLTAENAYIHLLTAWKLQDTSGSKPLQRSVLQHYILCIETVVSGVMRKLKSERADQIKQAERKFAEEFAAELHKRADKPAAIREASTNLRMIGFQNALPAIEMVAARLGLSNDLRDGAKDLYRLRSRSLSHPGRAEQKEFDKWLRQGPTISHFCAADEVARAFLSAYFAS